MITQKNLFAVINVAATVVIAFATIAILSVTQSQRDLASSANDIADTQNAITGKQSKISDRQSKIMGQQSKIMGVANSIQRATDRAFVYFGNVSLRRYPPDKPDTQAVEMFAFNTGNTPARHVIGNFKCPHGTGISEPYDAPEKWQSLNHRLPNFLGPKQSVKFLTCQFPLDIIDKTQNTPAQTFIVVEIEYEDAFDIGKKHITQMVRHLQIDSSDGKSFYFFGPHNCTDPDCP